MDFASSTKFRAPCPKDEQGDEGCKVEMKPFVGVDFGINADVVRCDLYLKTNIV